MRVTEITGARPVSSAAGGDEYAWVAGEGAFSFLLAWDQLLLVVEAK
jgi:hypothetical protein